mmetsp:Transcript_11354/g.46096  ORF Transcript_11354/g.46096 Transcript_11354/m.46096 type:complete len:156 (+) Transcript_11354:56-523(+)
MGLKHGISMRKLNRTPSHRRALWRNMVTQLIMHEKIKTTVPKAKELRPIADRMVTLAKQGGLLANRKVRDYVRTEEAARKLLHEYPKRFNDRQGGYTRITPVGHRKGDSAPMATIEYITEPVEFTRARRQFVRQIKRERALFKQEFLQKEYFDQR